MTTTSTEVWLYGSTARGDTDDRSDVDVLVVGDPRFPLTTVGLDASVIPSSYTWREIEHMAEYGSLFLHHIRLEGRPLVETTSRRLRGLLEALPRYVRANQELDSFERVVADVGASIDRDHSPAFELAVLATAARHAAILGCYLLGEPEFGRHRAFRRLLPQLGYTPACVMWFERLYDYRVMENRGEAPATSPQSGDVRRAVSAVRKMIGKVRRLVDEHSG